MSSPARETEQKKKKKKSIHSGQLAHAREKKKKNRNRNRHFYDCRGDQVQFLGLGRGKERRMTNSVISSNKSRESKALSHLLERKKKGNKDFSILQKGGRGRRFSRKKKGGRRRPRKGRGKKTGSPGGLG